jgi:hypothetical protein
VKRKQPLFRKRVALFRKRVALFRKCVALFRKRVALFRQRVALFRKRVALFRKRVALFRKRVAPLVAQVKRKQLEFINGGWCMHDEASPLWTAMVDQTTRGHQFILKHFGVEASPAPP